MSNNSAALLAAMRLPFLLLTLAVVLLGIALATTTNIEISVTSAALVLCGALTAHISVNLLNEYQDFHSGLDNLTEKTPFSGGSGALIVMPSAAKFIGKMTVLFLVITIVIGLYFALTIGLPIVLIGVLGLAIILLYTQWINTKPILCLISSGLAFGPLMLLGTYYVLTGGVTWAVFLVALVPFFLTNNLLLINQFPDIAPDKSVGRNHFPIKYGINKSLYVYLSFALLAIINTLAILLSYNFPALAYTTLIPMVIAPVVVLVLMKRAAVINNIIIAMAVSVMNAVVSPLLLALAIYIN